MGVYRTRWQPPWKVLGALLLVCTASAMAHCSAAVHESSSADASVPDSSSGGGPSDAGGSDGKAVIQGIGSKCLTVCPMHLTCDPYKWKGFCTKDCMTDNDCQGTGVPPVKGVCGADNRCYKACDPTTDPCTRQQWTCVGPPGDMYCNNFYDAHYCKPDSASCNDDASVDASVDASAPAVDAAGSEAAAD
jgi:hypothetical protein